MKRVCKCCGKDFEVKWENSKQKYCSRKCVYKSQEGREYSKLTRNKIALSNSKPHTEERKRNISEAKKIKITNIQYDTAVKLLSESIYSDKMIQNETNLTYRPYNRLKRDIIKKYNLYDVENNRHRGANKGNALLEKANVEFIRDNYKTMTRRDLCNSISYNTAKSKDIVSAFCKKHFKEPPKKISGEFHKGKTKPELIIENSLLEMGIDNEYNYTFRCKDKNGYFIDYAVDFYLPIQNIIIEVQGDYWHGNPKIYESFDSTQRNNKNRDKRKKAQILNQHNINQYIEIWESDINNNLNSVEKEIYEITK